ncbi:hypothetical protein JGH11_15795 [Dysgonomonas sp. Marseille-P4677]|uniref:hypothetical protein n=1 Tax=Dysgonomonas sp. Marseille-P4677 TaxID=2364790 RepID=UPI001914B182|nr:hypothetical protein [Dysgonomonas sp. Marseille-P4677]MBK5722338.1 hypothetical protein [Dysgonomonas sp. Marseille-P4677]
MKKIFLFSFTLTVIFISCQNKQSNSFVFNNRLDSIHISINDTMLSNNFGNIDFERLPRLTMAEYKNLQLDKVTGLQGYDTTYLSMGRTLLLNDNGKIITIQVITDGEIAEYLISYDKSGNLMDNLIVAYEDMVEYYSRISTQISSDQITVQTINFSYSDKDDNPIESSDTAITKYQITPEYKFILN